MKMGKFLLAVLRSRVWLLLGVAGASFCLCIGYYLLAPDQYRALASLFIDPGYADGGQGAGSVAAPRGTDLDLLRSERVAQRVVESEHLVEEPALRPIYLESIDAGQAPVEALAQYLSGHFQAGTSGDGSVVQIAVTLSDPLLAMRVANAYAQAWGEVNLELRTAAIRNGVERAHEDLAVLRARLGEARARLGNNRDLAAAGTYANAQFDQLARLARDTPHHAPETAASVVGAPEGKGPASVRLPLALDGAEPFAPEYTAPVAATTTDAARATTADEEIRLAQQSLVRAEERLARLSAEGIGSPFPAHVLRAARLPQTSIKPDLKTTIGVGTMLAAFLGLIAVTLAEVLDRRVRRPGDLSRVLGLVVLGTLPATRTTQEQSKALGMAPRWLRMHRSEGAA